MTQEPAQPKTPPAQAAPPAANQPAQPQKDAVSPAEAIKARIHEIQQEIGTLRKEVKSRRGRLSNRDSAVAKTIQAENDSLKSKLRLLERALYSVMADAGRPRQQDDLQKQFEVLQQAAVEYCKSANIDKELWKNIAS